MADTAAIENLVVRLTGDASSFQRMMNAAIGQTMSFGATVRQTLTSIAEFAGFRSSVSAFSDYQDNLVRIEATIKANGLAVDETMKKYKEFADQIEATSRVSAIDAIKLLGVASTYDLVGKKAMKAADIAVAISQARGGDPREIMGALSMFMDAMSKKGGASGGGRGVYRLAYMLGISPGGRGGGEGGGAESQKELIEKINKRLAEYKEMSDKLGQNFGGQMKRISNYLQDIGEQLGEIVGKWLAPFVQKLQLAVKWFKDLSPATKSVFTILFSLATILTVGGPLMRFFMLLGGLAASISPITVALTAAAVATVAWIHDVGGLTAAWEQVRDVTLGVLTGAVKWIQQTIAEHKRLALAIGLVAAALGAAFIVYRLAFAAIALINTVLTVLYIKQLANNALWLITRTAVLAWRGALLVTRVAVQAFYMTMSALSALWSGAKFLGALVLTAVKLVALIGLWLAYKAVMLSVQVLMHSWDMVVAVWDSLKSAIQAVGIGLVKFLVLTLQGWKVMLDLAGGITNALEAIGWGFYTGAITAATIATTLFDLAETYATAGLNLLVGAIILAVVAFGGWLFIITPITIALHVLSATVVALTTFVITAATAVGTFFVTAFVGFAGAIMVAWSGLKGFFDVLLAIPGKSGVLAEVGGLFREWGGILMDVYHAIGIMPETIKKINSPLKETIHITDGLSLAWAILKTGFQLAVLEIRGRWPALWDFIKTVTGAAISVLEATWKAFSAKLTFPIYDAWLTLMFELKQAFFQAIKDILKGLWDAISKGGASTALARIFGGLDLVQEAMHSIDQSAQNLTRVADPEKWIGMKHAVKSTADELNRLIESQKKAVADAAAKGLPVDAAFQKQIDAKKKELEELRKFLTQAEAKQSADQKKLDLGAPFRQATKEIEKWEAVLYGSAEAYSKVQEYFDKLKESGEKAGVGEAGTAEGKAAAALAEGGGGGGGGKSTVENLLVEIREAIKNDMKRDRPVHITNVKNGKLT